MPTPTEIISQIIDPIAETVAELERAVEGAIVHIAGPETITGLKTFSQLVTAPEFHGNLVGDIAAGTRLLGDLDMNGFGLVNFGAAGLEVLSNKGVANGYAPLGATGLVPAENLGTGGSDSGTNFLADDGQFRPISAGAVSFGTQAANLVFGGPGSGAAAAPAFRLLVAADIPALAESKITNLTTDLAAKVPNTRVLTAGNGLSGGGDLSADRTFTLATPSNLTVSTVNSVGASTHTHAISSSSNPGAAAALLATDGSGFLTIPRLTLTDYLLVNALVANLYLKDTSTGFQAAATGIITPQAGNIWRNTSYTSGISGWNIDDDGNAEFNNLNVRGSIRSSVFTVSEIAATAGTLGVFYSAATVQDDFTTPASTSSSFAFNTKNSDAGGMLFAVGDIVRFKTWTGSGISDSWATITARVNHTTYATYTATLNSGSTSAVFTAGTAAVDYGPSGTGFITLSADGTVGSSPNLTMATHAGSPWTTQTTLLRMGNLNGSYGYATAIYGVGIGQYGVASKSWLTIDQTNGIRLGNNTTVFGHWETNGDFTLGQVALNSANAHWSNAEKQLQFRGGVGGTVIQTFIDIDGSFKAGSEDDGYVSLDSTGLSMPSGDVAVGRIKWSNSGFISSANDPVVTTLVFSPRKIALAADNGSSGGLLWLDATAGHSYFRLFDSRTATFGGTSIFDGITIGSANIPTHMLDVYGEGWFQKNVKVAGANTVAAASVGTFDYDSGYARLASYGPDASTRGAFRIFLIKSDGTSTLTALEISAAGAPSLFVDGALKAVAAGAADSGGTGYKMLRVPN